MAGVDQTGCRSKQHEGKDCAEQANQQLDANGYSLNRSVNSGPKRGLMVVSVESGTFSPLLLRT